MKETKKKDCKNRRYKKDIKKGKKGRRYKVKKRKN